MNNAIAFHTVRELALAGCKTPADTLAVYDALAELARDAGLTIEARIAARIAAGLRGEETMELRFKALSKGGLAR